jgi:hypothetical protein
LLALRNNKDNNKNLRGAGGPAGINSNNTAEDDEGGFYQTQQDQSPNDIAVVD